MNHRGVLIVASIAIGLGGCLVIAGAPVWISFALATVPWLVVLRARFGAVLAIAAGWLGGLAMVLLIMIATAALHWAMLLTVTSVLSVIGILGCVLWNRGAKVTRAHSGGAAILLPALLGTMVWLVVSCVNAIANPIGGLSWAMHGDSANYVLFARGITGSGGIVTAASQNPVPLPSALLALFMASGRGGVADAQLLRHDVASYEMLQLLVIAASCFLAGVLAGLIVRTVRPGLPVVVATAAAGSLLPLSWTITTNAIAYGYFDALLALPTIFACIIVGRTSREHPAFAIGLLGIGTTVLSAVWTPMVVVPLGCLVVVVVIERAQVVQMRGPALLFVALAAAQLVTYGLAVTFPGFLAQGKFLAATGAGFGYTHSLLPSLAAMSVLLSLLMWRVAGPRDALPGIVLPVALELGLAFMLYESHTALNDWSYFPSKFEWLSIAVLLVATIGLVPLLFSLRPIGQPGRIAAIIAVVSMTAIVISSTPDFAASNDWANPLTWIAQKNNVEGGSAAAARVLAGANLAAPTIYWQSNVPFETYIDYWLIDVAARSIDNNTLRKYAYSYDESSTGQLCAILGLIHRPTRILTRSRSLAVSIGARCPDAGAQVVMLSEDR